MIEERTKTVTRDVLVSPATFEDVDTGEFYKTTRINAQGEEITIQEPIYKRVMKDAQYVKQSEDKKVYIVADGGEEHEFTTYKDAKRFEETLNA